MRLVTQIFVSVILGVIIVYMGNSDNIKTENIYSEMEYMMKQEYSIEELKKLYWKYKWEILNMEETLKNTLLDMEENIEQSHENVVE